MSKYIMVAEGPDHVLVIAEYDPLQFTFEAACLVMEDHFGIIFIAYVAFYVSDEGHQTRMHERFTTASNSRQET